MNLAIFEMTFCFPKTANITRQTLFLSFPYWGKCVVSLSSPLDLFSYIKFSGRWGGIWKAPRSYSFVKTDNSQTGVRLTKKFDEWGYSWYGLKKRMPWLYGERLTTAGEPKRNEFGSITG